MPLRCATALCLKVLHVEDVEGRYHIAWLICDFYACFTAAFSLPQGLPNVCYEPKTSTSCNVSISCRCCGNWNSDTRDSFREGAVDDKGTQDKYAKSTLTAVFLVLFFVILETSTENTAYFRKSLFSQDSVKKSSKTQPCRGRVSNIGALCRDPPRQNVA